MTRPTAERRDDEASRRARRGPIADLPARTALRIANHGRVRPLLAARHEHARARHARMLPPIAAADREIVESVERDGVCIRHLDTFRLHGAARAVAAATRLADAFAGEARARVLAGEDFVTVPSERIVAEPPIYGLGLNERLLTIAETYLGLPVAYDGVTVNYTVADGRAVSTRRWHRDWEDRRMLKVAIYLNAVDADGGPFELVPGTTGDHNDTSGYRYELATDEALARRFGAAEPPPAVTCLGAAGTIVFADTARFFHRGRPATARDRKAVFYSYFARPPRHPFLCERTGLTRAQIATLATRLTPRQRDAALWRRALPLWLRMIPPARI